MARKTDPNLMKDIYDYYREFVETSAVTLDPQIAEAIMNQYLLSPKLAVLFSYIVDKLGYNESILVVDSKRYRKVRSKTLFRGVENADFLVPSLFDKSSSSYKGSGIYGSGLYYSTRKNRAELYAKGEKGLVGTFKFDPDIQVLTSKYKHKLINEIGLKYDYSTKKLVIKHNQELDGFLAYLDNAPENERDFWVMLSLKDFNQVAAILGYDAVETDDTPKSIIFLNRGKLFVKDKTIKDILKSSEKYSNCDFNQFISSNKNEESAL